MPKFCDEMQMMYVKNYDYISIVSVTPDDSAFALAVSASGRETLLGYSTNLDNLKEELKYAMSLPENDDTVFIFTNEQASERCASLVPKVKYSKEVISEWFQEQVIELTGGENCVEFKPDTQELKDFLDDYKNKLGMNPYVLPPKGESDKIFVNGNARAEFIAEYNTALSQGGDLTPLQDRLWEKLEQNIVRKLYDTLVDKANMISSQILKAVEKEGAEFQSEFFANFKVQTLYGGKMVISDWEQFGLGERSFISQETKQAIHKYVENERYASHTVGLRLEPYKENGQYWHASLSNMLSEAKEVTPYLFKEHLNNSIFVDYLHQQGCLIADVADAYRDLKDNPITLEHEPTFEEKVAQVITNYGDAPLGEAGENAELFGVALKANLDDIYKIQSTMKEFGGKSNIETAIVLPSDATYAVVKKSSQQNETYFLPSERPFVINSLDVHTMVVDETDNKFYTQVLGKIMQQANDNSATLSVVPKNSPEIETAKANGVKGENFANLHNELVEESFNTLHKG